MHSPPQKKNIERQKENKSGSVQIKLKRHLVIKGDHLEAYLKQTLGYNKHWKTQQKKYKAFARTGAVLLDYLVGCNQTCIPINSIEMIDLNRSIFSAKLIELIQFPSQASWLVIESIIFIKLVIESIDFERPM